MDIEKLPNTLSFEMKCRLSSEIDNLEDNLEKLSLDKNVNKSFQIVLAKLMLESYSEGRMAANLVRLMGENGYILTNGENWSRIEDLLQYQSDYFSDSISTFSDSINSLNNRLNGINNNLNNLPLDEYPNLYDFVSDLVKRQDTNRTMEVTYIDKWIMYNKLFSNKQI